MFVPTKNGVLEVRSASSEVNALWVHAECSVGVLSVNSEFAPSVSLCVF